MKQLNEGVRFGAKQIQEVKDNIELFQMGVEYEYHPAINDEGYGGDFDLRDNTFLSDFREIPESQKDEGDVLAYFDYLRGLYVGGESVIYGKLYNGEWDEFKDSYNGQTFNGYEFLDGVTPADIGYLVLAYYNAYKLHMENDDDSVTNEDVEELYQQYDVTEDFHVCREYIISLSHTNAIVEALGGDPERFEIKLTPRETAHIFYNLVMEKYGEVEDVDMVAESIGSDYLSNFDDERFVQVIGAESVTYYKKDNTESDAEYEYGKLPEDLRYDIKTYVDEHDNMVEMITEIQTIEDGLDTMKRMFEYISENGETSNSSGLHISISVKNNPEKVDLVKFLILSQTDYITDEFTPRTHVSSVYEYLKMAVETALNSKVKDVALLKNPSDVTKISISDIMDDLVSDLLHKDGNDILRAKRQTIKFGDYEALNGRIELRYFGGKDYEEEYYKIEWHIYRALYILLISSTDAYNKEYKQELYSLVTKVMEEMGEHVYVEFFKDITRAQKASGGVIERLIERFRKRGEETGGYFRMAYDTLIQYLESKLEK